VFSHHSIFHQGAIFELSYGLVSTVGQFTDRIADLFAGTNSLAPENWRFFYNGKAGRLVDLGLISCCHP
jgi:hypothetical protein